MGRIEKMKRLIIEEANKRILGEKKVQIYPNGNGSLNADTYNGTVQPIIVKNTVGNEPFKDTKYMEEKGNVYVNAINNKEEWVTQPVKAIIHPYNKDTYVVVDGNHRRYAYMKTNTPEINAIIIPHSDVLLMKNEWTENEENAESTPLTDVLNDREMIDKYFVHPDGTHSFKNNDIDNDGIPNEIDPDPDGDGDLDI